MILNKTHALIAAVTAALLVHGLPETAADALPGAKTIRPILLTAKTIGLKETVYLTGSGSMQIFFTNNVNIKRPNKVRVTFNQAMPGRKPHQYAMDGKIEYEYNALTNQYSTVSPAPDGSSMSQLRDISKIDLILSGGILRNMPPSSKEVASTGVIDGQPMKMDTYYPPSRKDDAGDVFSFPEQVWTNARTGILRRWVRLMIKNGKSTPVEDVEFTHWVFNKAIPDSELAFAPPAGAKPYAPPVLLPVGSLAPDFALTQSDGTLVHLSDFKGKVVVLDFWATWCGPCQSSMPHLEQVYEQVKNAGVAVLAVCIWDQKPAYDKWVTRNIGTRYNFPVAFDGADRSSPKALGNSYKLTGIPTQYVIGPDGRISSESVGYTQGDHDLEKNLAKLGIASTPTSSTSMPPPAEPPAPS
jgi:thiol-disulfide isomerase/thioredoxin/outer membrane lipoprotein-sorting protein